MKKCPFCAEEIQETAIKCRFCGEWLKDIAHPCKVCKTWIRKSDMECPFCGYQYIPRSESLIPLEENEKAAIESALDFKPKKESRLKQALEELERSMIIEAMGNTSDHQTNAANLLGISERMLRYKLIKYSLIDSE